MKRCSGSVCNGHINQALDTEIAGKLTSIRVCCQCNMVHDPNGTLLEDENGHQLFFVSDRVIARNKAGELVETP